MSSAAADISLQELDDLGLSGFGIRAKKTDAAHNHSGGAIGALKSSGVKESLLDRMKAAVFFKTFDGGDRFGRRGADWNLTGSARGTSDEHSAGTALPFSAAIFGAGEAEVIAQNVEERGIRGVADLVLFAVYFEFDRVGHILSLRHENRGWLVLVTGVASGFGVIHLVAAQTAIHGCDAGDFGHGCHFADLSVAGLALYARFEMGPMSPGDARKNGVDADPRNGLLGFGVLREFLDGGFVLGDGHMALHTFVDVREGHQFSGLGIDVAIFAFETEGEMLFVAIRNGLLRSGVRTGIVRYGGLGDLRVGGLLS